MLTKRIFIKLTLFLLFSYIGRPMAAQSDIIFDHVWQYDLSVEGITDPDAAKTATALLHPIFKTLPQFSMEDFKFHFESRIDKSLEELETLLEEYDIQIMEWQQQYVGHSSADTEESEEGVHK